MKKWKAAVLAVLLCIGMVSSAQAKIDWEISNSFKAEIPVLDTAVSFDGKYVFVLSPGKVQILSNTGNLEDTLQVDPAMSTISVTGFDRAGIDNKIILSSKDSGEVQQIAYNFIVNINTAGSPWLGSATAPVSLVIFSDFQ
ncbi:MAG: hypothetical protein H8E41_12625 [Desulfobulbaceae bacterium]|uniref:Pilus formation protein N-terminal domain-containing protein n=1 Tax=Candidatus Desulfobia pelagia TaxID=2841692 RepID=A0A8J6TGE1_9BACT|nr:hypothetical protein [Candidatus Desulfobia pelagia]